MATDFRPVDERIRAALAQAKERAAMTELAVPAGNDVALASARQAAVEKFDLEPLRMFYGAFVKHHSCAATDKQYMED